MLILVCEDRSRSASRGDNARLRRRLVRFVFVVLVFAVSGPAAARDPLELKQVPFSDFLGKEVTTRAPILALDLTIPVPGEFERTTFDREPGSSYWMRSSEVAAANATGDVHSAGGHMLGYISTSAAYDADRDVFVGADDPKSLAAAQALYPGLTHKRYRANDRAVLLMTAIDPPTGKHIYAAYFAAGGQGSFVVYIAFLPPGNSGAVGDFVWDKLRDNLEHASRSRHVDVAHESDAEATTQDEMGAQSFAEKSVASRGTNDRDIAGAVEAVVNTARTLGFYYDASRSPEGLVCIAASTIASRPALGWTR